MHIIIKNWWKDIDRFSLFGFFILLIKEYFSTYCFIISLVPSFEFPSTIIISQFSSILFAIIESNAFEICLFSFIIGRIIETYKLIYNE